MPVQDFLTFWARLAEYVSWVPPLTPSKVRVMIPRLVEVLTSANTEYVPEARVTLNCTSSFCATPVTLLNVPLPICAVSTLPPQVPCTDVSVPPNKPTAWDHESSAVGRSPMRNPLETKFVPSPRR